MQSYTAINYFQAKKNILISHATVTRLGHYSLCLVLLMAKMDITPLNPTLPQFLSHIFVSLNLHQGNIVLFRDGFVFILISLFKKSLKLVSMK